MSTLLQVWPWLLGAMGAVGTLWRMWRGRGQPPPQRSWEDPEEIIFGASNRPARPGRGLARLLSSPMLLALKEAGEAATADEMAGLREDLKRSLADNKRLRAELASSDDSNAPFSAMDTAPSPPLRTRRPRSSKSDS